MTDNSVEKHDDDHVYIQYGPRGTTGPVSDTDLDRLSEALTMSSWETGIKFSVYIGDLGDDRRVMLSRLHRALGESAPHACLVAVSPNQRAVEVAVGAEVAKRLTDRACNLAVLAMTTNFSGGDLIGGICNGLRMLSDQAGHAPAVGLES